VNQTVSLFDIDENKRYMCVARQNLLSRNESALIDLIEVSTYSLQVEAFRNSASGEFSSGSVRCKADEVSQLVPIIVGAVLAGLIVVVLIAYLIGRRRSRRGYESV
jgi:lysosomal-associated membrane protein 1/2